MQVQPRPIIVNEDDFTARFDNLAGQMTVKTGFAIQTSVIATFRDKPQFKTHLESNCINPGKAIIDGFDERLKNFFNRIVGDVFPIIDAQPKFTQIKEMFNIDSELLRKITECSSATLIQDCANDCDAENPIIIDRIITAPRSNNLS